MNNGTVMAERLTEPCWISSQPLTDNYSVYLRVHALTESWRAANIQEHTRAFVCYLGLTQG